MDRPLDFKEVAAHLAHPRGDTGIAVAQNMNRSNGGMTRRTIDLLGITDGDAILEIGPGNGALATYATAKARDVRYTGADISETMVEEASRMHRHAIDTGILDFRVVDGENLPFPAGAFDKVMTVNTLYFWKNPKQQLSEIRRVLRPAGICCLAIASKAFMEKMPFSPYGFQLYSEEEARQLLEENGFIIDQVAVGTHETSGHAGQVLMREEIIIRAGVAKNRGQHI